MAAFQNLTDRINHVFSKLKNRGVLTELEIRLVIEENLLTMPATAETTTP